MGNQNTVLKKQLQDLTDKHNKLKDLLSIDIAASFGETQHERDVLCKFIEWISANYHEWI
jgi:hypothetical protein